LPGGLAREGGLNSYTLNKNGHAAAQYNLGLMYSSGRGVAKDEAEAVRWYAVALVAGHPLVRLLARAWHWCDNEGGASHANSA
jgi:TPR repeat protein